MAAAEREMHMPTYCVGTEPSIIRKSFREVLCEQCGKTMGSIYEASMPGNLDGLSARDVLVSFPYMKLDIDTHETQCPGRKK